MPARIHVPIATFTSASYRYPHRTSAESCGYQLEAILVALIVHESDLSGNGARLISSRPDGRC